MVQSDEKEADTNFFSVLLSTLDHETLTVQLEETEEEMKDGVFAASPDMQMKENQEEQLEDYKAMKADWTIINSQDQQRKDLDFLDFRFFFI